MAQKTITLANNEGSQLLHIATRFKKLNVVKYLIQLGAQISSRDKSNKNSLDIAIETGDYELFHYLWSISQPDDRDLNSINLSSNDKITKFLLENLNEKINDSINKDGTTPLHESCRFGNDEITKQLLDHDASPEICDNLGRTPLFEAVNMNQKESIRILSNADADINTVDDSGVTPILLSATESDLETVNFLIEIGADILAKDNAGNNIAHFLAKRTEPDPSITNAFKEKGIDFNQENNDGITPLVSAINNNNKLVVEDLIKVGKSNLNQANKEGKTPCIIAASCNVSILKTLVDNGAILEKKDNKNRTLIYEATSPEIINYLQQNNVKTSIVDKDGITPLVEHIIRNRDDVVIQMINNGVSLDDKNPKDGSMAIHIASKNANDVVVGSLAKKSIENGDKDIMLSKDNQGRTPAIYLATADQNNVKPQSIQRTFNVIMTTGGQDSISGYDDKGNAPIHYAAIGNTDFINSVATFAPQLLNQQNIDGNTPLHIASLDPNNIKTLENLLEKDAVDPMIRNKDNESASKTADKYGNFQNEQLISEKQLKRYGALKGDIELGLSWFCYNDLDLHSKCPCGTEIYFFVNVCNNCGGNLDVDMNVGGKNSSKSSDEPKEHIRWENPKDGSYQAIVNHFDKHESFIDDTEFIIWLNMKGQNVFIGKGSLKNKETIIAFSFEVCDQKIKNIESNRLIQNLNDIHNVVDTKESSKMLRNLSINK